MDTGRVLLARTFVESFNAPMGSYDLITARLTLHFAWDINSESRYFVALYYSHPLLLCSIVCGSCLRCVNLNKGFIFKHVFGRC